MKKCWKVFRSDLRRITSSVIAVVVIMGLCLVPCLYAWFNILSNWDPYGPDSTSNIKVAVANEDTGYEILGIELNIGELVLDGLESNKQMGWVFLDSRYDALQGVSAGDYYAALIIPKRFTRDFIGIIRGDLDHPKIEYYENMKKNAIAPKITNKAKTAVQDQINSTIIEKAAGVVDTLNTVFKAFGLDPDEAIHKFIDKLDDTCKSLDRLTLVLSSSQKLLGDTQVFLDASSVFSHDAGKAMISSGNSAGSASDSINVSAGLVDSASGTINGSLNEIDGHLQRIIIALDADPGALIKADISDQVNIINTDLTLLDGKAPNLSGLSAAHTTMQNAAGMMGAAPEYTGLNDRDTRTAVTTLFSTDMTNSVSAMSAALDALNTAKNTAASSADQLTAQLNEQAVDPDAVRATLQSIQGALSGIVSAMPTVADRANQLTTAMLDAVDSMADEAVKGEMLNNASQLQSELTGIGTCIEQCKTDIIQNSLTPALTALNNDMTNLGSLDTESMLADLDEIDRLIIQTKDTLPTFASRADQLLATTAQMRGALQNANDPETKAGIVASARNASTTIRETALTLNEDINNYVQETSAVIQTDLNDAQALLYKTGLEAEQLSGTLAAYAVAIGSTQQSMGEAVKLSMSVRAGVGQLADDVRAFADSEAFRQLVDVIENNPDGLAEYLATPVNIQTEIIYEIADYGSAMSPYYIMLALFVGSLLAATMIKVQVKSQDIVSLRPAERYFGRFLLFFFIGMTQALVTALGCLYYVGIQCLHPGLFILACCICSLNFAMMNFSLVYSLDNIGMGAAVIIMVIQVAGSGGSYPVDVLPPVYKALYPFMPFHYGMDMIRETIGGMYDGTYLKCAAILLGMCVLFCAVGLLLYYPAKGINGLIAKSKEETGIM